MLPSETCPTHQKRSIPNIALLCFFFLIRFRFRVSRIFVAGKVGVGLIWLLWVGDNENTTLGIRRQVFSNDGFMRDLKYASTDETFSAIH